VSDPALARLSIAEAARLIAAGEVSPVDLTEACIGRAERLDGALNAFLTPTFEAAREEARRAEAELKAGRSRGPLHGVPFALKDLYETAGVVTTAASPIRANFVPEADAAVVTRLRQAGVIMLGKLNLHEWALGATNINVHYPSPRNPWDGGRITGGSSGGSGAALAAGLCFGSLGSDTGGSIRIPASLCGVTGLKATYGRVSLRGVVPLSWHLDHAGPMARTALDCALILQAIAGHDPEDPFSAAAPVPDYAAQLLPRLGGIRIGLARGYLLDDGIDAEVAAAVREAAAVFASLGATVRDVEVPGFVEASRANGAILVADAAAYHQEDMKERADLIGPTVRARLEAGASLPATTYALARRTQAEFKLALRSLFREIDLLLAPATPGPAPAFPVGDTVPATAALTRNTGAFNLAGVPALAAPCGFTKGGLPIGMMLVGRPWEEALVLRAAHAYQTATDWHERRPPLW
jgi:aspartyl-tRNA(Asn)/glutamyl-tRNA(Gln) amidotransferase subunit A